MSKVFYEIGQTICPDCGYVADSQINFQANEPSKRGDIAFCNQCGNLSMHINHRDRVHLDEDHLAILFAARPDVKELYDNLKKNL